MQKIKFFNSGLYNNEPYFYKTYNTHTLFKEYEHDSYREYDSYTKFVNYNYALIKTRYSKDQLSQYQDEDEIKRYIDGDFFKNINNDDTLYSPNIFNENIALECGLIPFTYIWWDKHMNLLSRDTHGYDVSFVYEIPYELCAYQVLTDNSIDNNSPFLNRANEDQCRQVLGDDIYNKVIASINGEVIW